MGFEIGTLFCGPLRVENRTLGVIYADHPSPLSEISESMINLFAACCHFAATAIASTAQGSVIDLEHLPAEIRKARVAELLGSQDDARAREIYEAIQAGNGTFEELVKTPFKSRGLAREVVLGILSHALAETRGRYKEALKLLGVRESDYHSTMTFLERHGCCADFRPFRRARPLPRDP